MLRSASRVSSRADDDNTSLQLTRLLMNEATIGFDQFKYYRGTEEVFVLWQQRLFPHYYEDPIDNRNELAIRSSVSGSFNEAALFRRALTRDSHIPRATSHRRSIYGVTLLHAVARTIGEVTYWHDRPKEDRFAEELLGLAYSFDINLSYH